MSVSLDYWTTVKVKPDLKRRLETAAAEFVRGRRWWAESLCFFKWPGKDGHLAGSTKFSRSDADPEDDMFMADVDMLAILEQLAAWSKTHGVDWEVQLAGEKWGTIRGGKLDAKLKKFCTEAKKSLGKPAQAEKRIAAIFSEYDGESTESAAAPKVNVKELQKRWTTAKIKSVDKLIAMEDSYEAMKANTEMAPRPLTAGLVPTYVEGGVTWQDLRGFPIQRFYAMAVDHVDLSYCTARKDEVKGVPPLGIIMTRCNLTDCRLVGAGPFYSCGDKFVRCDFTSAKMRGALARGTFVECNFTNADLGRIQIALTKFEKCRFIGTRFVKAEIDMTTKFIDCVFQGCNWEGAMLLAARFKGCDVRNENFTGTECQLKAFDAGCQTDGVQL